MEYIQHYDNTFNMGDYFQKNYGMPEKPQAPVLEEWESRGCFLTILLFFIWIPMRAKMRKRNELLQAAYESALEAWEAALTYRRIHWHAEYDRALPALEESLGLKARAMQRLGISPGEAVSVTFRDGGKSHTLEPFCIHGSLYDRAAGYIYRTDRIREDGVCRSDARQYTYFFFCDGRLMVYTCSLRLSNPDERTEKIADYFYYDVVDVSVIEETAEGTDMEDPLADPVAVKKFQLTVPGGKVAYMYTPDEALEGLPEVMTRFFSTAGFRF